MRSANLHDSIVELTKELKLPGIRSNFKDESISAAKDNLAYDKFLLNVLEKEYESRISRRMQRRIRVANFPYKKYLEDLSSEDLPADARNKYETLKSLDFIKNGHNVILAGNPGTGKTHMAIGLGIKACLEGFSVLFTTIPHLITELRETRSEKKLRTFENKFEKYDLVICDEFGYISFDKSGAEMLFTHLSLRAGRKSTIITTNLSFDRWSELFGDPVLTAAMVDRLTHKAYLVNMNGNSYRLKETKEWSEKREKIK
ncbi:MAG: ATP-binding protein [Desulfobacterales bacterium]|nr:ATP-binding protein [Desulfobacterales bacterium]